MQHALNPEAIPLAQLHIVVVDENRERALRIVDGLSDTGDYKVSVIGDNGGLARKISELQPDVILIDLENPSRDMFAEVTQASLPLERPVAMFVDKADPAMAQAAIEAGVSAYVVDGLRTERIKPILDTAIARFHAFSRLRAELNATKTALAERKMIDRAKGLLIKAKGLSEEEAYALLRRTAMDQGKRVGEVAENLVTAAGLLS
jgi:two-component system, response regulator / RNA-binding antiterminator